MAQIITFSPSASIFGCGALEKLPEALRSRGYKRVMIFTDRQIVECGILLRVLDLLKGIVQFEVFDSVPTEPRVSDIDAQKEQFGTDYDALLGLGGGSPMDFAKAMAIIMTYGGSLGDYVGEGTVLGPVMPVVCIPTTSGTGSRNTQSHQGHGGA
jgi:alcohol dehydrogenase class IV